MNSTHRKRLFTILLSILLTISMLPAGAFADVAEGVDDQDQVVTEQSDQDYDQPEAPAPEQPADVDEGSNETVDVVEDAEEVEEVEKVEKTEPVEKVEKTEPAKETSEGEHTWGEWAVTKEPTCTQEGERERTCETCGETETEKVDKKEHKWDNEGLYCKDCKTLKVIAEGGSYDFEMDGESWVIAGDASADVEDAKDWEAMFADSKFTDNWAEDLVMVAKSQKGYKESKKNFAISENLNRKGYSRYGAWAGEPYADWSPLFVSFCLHFANVDMPYYEEDFDKWITDLEKENMFADADGYVPRSGDLVFFDLDKDGDIDAAGIVESYDANRGVIKIIEGDHEDEVAEREVNTSDSAIAGYGILPENPKVSNEAKTEQEEKTEEKTVTSKKAKKAGTRDGGKLSPKDQADIYYGPGGTAETYTVTLTETGNHTTAMAGDTLAYNVEISMLQAATYAYNDQDQQPMFTTWENITIEMKLPPQEIITGVIGNQVASFAYDEDRDVWVITLVSNHRDATNSNDISFHVNTRIEGNGELADGTVLELSDDDTKGAEVTVSTEFNLIVDEYGNTDPTIPPYTFTETSYTNPITLTTPDVWKLFKSPFEHSYDIDKTNKKVTIHYLIQYGLEVNGVPSSDPNVYTSIGRVPYDHDIVLTDTPQLTDARGNSLVAESVTVTPRYAGYKYKDGTSADEGGNPKPISVVNGQATLPYAVVGNNDKFVDEDAPAYSEYKVDMVYDYDDFMVWYHENLSSDEAQSVNTAKIDYQLLGQTAKYTQDPGDTKVPAYIGPGKITIEKNIVNYDNNNSVPYDSNVKAPVTGPATYEIFKSDGTTAATIYYKDSDGKYQTIKDADNNPTNIVTIDPSQAASSSNGTNGTISFYLDAGTYVIKETGAPANTQIATNDTLTKTKTVNENGEVTAEFNNKEQLGQIKIKKTDDTNNHNLISNCVFGLYEDAAHTKPIKDANGNHITATTESGYAIFKRLVPGTYYVWEISAPEGYVKYPNSIPVTVTVNNTGEQYTVPVENHVDGKIIYLQKKYSTVADPNNFIDVTGDYAAFANAFKLQKSTDGVNWTDVQSYSIDDQGKANISVAEYDNQEHKLQYRFVETIPAGYYGEDYETGTATSRVVIPADCTTTDQLTVVMKNRRDGIIELTKKKVTVNSNSGVYTAANYPNKTFSLYRVAEGSTAAEKVAEQSSDSDGKIRYTGLAAVDSSSEHKLYTYYVVEESPDDGYTWVTDSSINIDGEATPALEIGSFTSSSGGTLEATAYNIQQDIVIGIVKKDKLTNTQLANAKFTVSDGTNSWTVTSKSNAKATRQISLGKNYTITETEVPAGYYLDAAAQTIDTTGWTVKRKANGDYAIFKADGTTEVTADDLTFTFKDTPYKKLRVTKKAKNKNQSDSSASNLSNIKFKVYVKNGNSFEEYKINGTAVEIKADGTATVALPQGDYYLHEENPPSSVVNPDQHPEEYAGKGESSNGKFYFGPYTSTKPTASGDILWDVAIININNKGDIIVRKRTYDENNQLITDDAGAVNGFSMQLFKADADGNPTGTALKTLVTSGTGANAGQAKFTGYPVYDSNGQPIKYVIVEKYGTDQAKVFYTDSFTSDASPVTAVLGDTADAGYVENHRYMTVNVTKKYYDAREYDLTGLEYPLAGATIALYKNNGDGTYTYVDSGTTNSKGKLAFGTLKYSEYGYVAIEVSIPDRPEYEYMVPKEGDYLQTPCPQELTEAQVAELSKVSLVSTTDPKYTGTIYNIIPWTQIHVTKWSDDDKPIKLDGADFTLYKQVLPDGTAIDAVLTFDEANCTVVGEYTSGTWIHNDQTQTGEFQTDVLDNADNIVYWLVETRAPSGYSIIDSENYVLFMREGRNYSNNSNNGNSTMVYTYNDLPDGEPGLKDNTINYHNVYDHHEVGPGDGTVNRAYIEFTKWMQKQSTADKPKDELLRTDFELMPNATFELYAVNASDHNKVYLLDTITTGDENLMDGTTTGYGVSRALDAWEIFDYMEENFPDQLDDIITYRSTSTAYPNVTYPYVLGSDGKPELDANGNRKRIKGTFWLNAVLVEKSSSSAYGLDIHDHNLQIVFTTGDFELGNDKYCVIDLDNANVDLCDENEDGRLAYDYPHNTMGIVDYLVIDNAVVLRHFGYDPELVGYNLLNSQLNTKHENNPSLFVSKQVTFALEKYNPATKEWEAWDPVDNTTPTGGATNTFVTDGNGYSFDSGLDAGEYRVVMTEPADGYENFYPNDGVAFYFTVVTSDRTQVFTTYSPSRPNVTIKKTDLDGNPITNAATFRLKSNTTDKTYDETATTSGGTAVFEELPADANYTLTETAAPEGYNNAYFVQLFKKDYPNYAALVEGTTGYPLSYETTTRKENPDDHNETVIVDKNYEAAFELEIPNTEDVKLKLTKVDSQDTDTQLKDATFSIYYHAFDKVSGNYTVPNFSDSDPAWVNLGSVTTGTDGTVTIDDDTFSSYIIKPGVYYAVETAAPPHYQLNTTGQRLVMTGGLPLVINPVPDNCTVCTTVGGTGELTFEDIPLKGITVKKVVDFGSLPKESYSFNFELKDSEGQSMTDTATGPTPEKDAVFSDLTQGAYYYLKEATKAGYKLVSVKIGNDTVNPETSGVFKDYYKIKMPTDGSGVTVTVTNIRMAAQVTILKYDGNSGARLTGAEFEVLDADENVVSNASVTDNGDGSYTAVIPLDSTAGADFYIHETKAPEIEGKKYTIDDNNDKILVEGLKPGQNRTFTFNGPNAGNNEYCLPNYEGVTVKIHKYGGLPGNETVDLEGAKFQMYFSTNDGDSWNSWHPAETTGSDGYAEFLILKGYKYAIAEINDVEGYVGLYNIYDSQDNPLSTDVSSDGRKLYILGDDFDVNREYEFTGYNIPYLKLVVEKKDFSKENNLPNAVENPNTAFHVYEVPDGTTEPLTDLEIAALIAQALPKGADGFIAGETEQSTYTNEQFIQPGKTYLAVEDHAKDPDSTKDDYSIIKDDTRVEHYHVFSVPLVDYKDEYSVTFVNIKGEVTIGLEKTVDPTEIDSLTLGDAELNYTLKPSTTNSYALDSYKLNDSGLTPTPADATLADEWYTIEEVIVGQGRMDKYLAGVKSNKDYDIFAKVTFVDFDNNEYPQDEVNVSGGNITVIPSGDAAGKNIKSFYVDYYSTDLHDDTGYYLGQNFEAGETLVTAKVFKQEKPAQGVVTAITKIRNDADVVLYYSPWSPEGVKQDSTDLHAEDFAETIVDGAKAPKISFNKTGPDMDTPIPIGSEITYQLTVENVTGEDLDFENPIIVDLLPRGISINPNSDFVVVTTKPDSIDDDPTITTGYAGDSVYVNIAFNGTLEDGDSIVVELTGTITTAVTNYGSNMRNFAFATSTEVGVATSDNAAGAVIKDDKGKWASELISLATRLNCDSERAEALKEALGTQGTYGYLGSWWQNNWVSETGLICVKAEYGPSDGGVYRTDKVSLIYNDNDDAQRTMHYQLTINNISDSKRTNLAVMDILPAVGDQRINNSARGSHWPLYFDALESVKVNDTVCDPSLYTVYYYGGDATAFTANDIKTIIAAAKAGTLDTDEWKTTKPAKPTAFIVVFAYDKSYASAATDEHNVILEGGKNVQIEYTAKTDYRDAEELNQIVFTNATNDFNFGFSTFAPPEKSDEAYSNSPLGSNVVEVTITPPYVKVGGDVWIDADDNGKQDDGDQSWYLNYDIVKQLVGDAVNNVTGDTNVKLITSNNQNYSIVADTTPGTIYRTGSDQNNYGVAHFEFDYLTAAKLRDGSTDYTGWNSAGNANKLVGKNPYTYHMDFGYNGNIFTKTINTVDPRGSYPPDSIPDDDQKDDNFNVVTGSVDYHSEQFFLHQTSKVFDMTKDVGFNLPKKLELTKYGQVNASTAIEGAEFKLYGPFDHGTGSAATLSNDNLIATLTTDSNGKITKDGLLFFKEYVIVETKAGDGYSIEGATATGNITKLAEGKWLLNVPAYDTVPSEDEVYTEPVIVRDPELINVGVEKEWDDDDDAYGARPTSINVRLYTDEACTVVAKYANGNDVESRTLNSSNNWKTTWTKLPRYKAENQPITYYVKETSSTGADLVGYNVVIVNDTESGSGNQNLTITNTPITKKLRVEKTWSEYDPSGNLVTKVKFKVEQSIDGNTWTQTQYKGNDLFLTLDRSAGETYVEQNGLPAYDADNNPITYRGVEVSITIEGQEYEVADGKVRWYNVTTTHTPGTEPTDTDLSQITNTYDAAGDIALKGNKTFKNGILDDKTDKRYKEFTFSIYPADAFDAAIHPPFQRERDRNMIVDDQDLIDSKIGSATTAGAQVEDGVAKFDFKFKDADGNFTKDTLEYVLADIMDGKKEDGVHLTKTFHYVAVEDIPASAVKKTVNGETFYYDSAEDIKYDPKVYVVDIIVTDTGRGTLNVRTSDGVVNYGFENEKIYTKLLLTKDLNSLVTGDTEDELTNVTFVFKVSYTDPILGRKVSRSVSVQFNADEVAAETATVDKIPIDATDLEVEEVYAADYTGKPIKLPAHEGIDEDTGLPLWTAEYKNSRNGDVTGGGVINTVKPGESPTGFVITNRRDSTGSNPPPPQQEPAEEPDFR